MIGAGCWLILPTESQAAELDEILERGYLVVGVKDNTQPLGFRDQSGALVGFEIDLARQLAVDLFGTPEALRLEPLTNQERLPRLAANDVDMVIARVSVTTPRARLVDFSVPYYLDGTAFVTQRYEVVDISDLQGQTVAVLNGSSTIDVVRSRLSEVRLIGVDSYQAALEQMETGAVAAFAADVSILSGWVQEYPDYRILPTLISADALAVAMPRGLQYLELRQWVNESLEEWTATGWLEDRMRYWGLP
ncbi:MAG: transporter substrate-binding domain-containing protein [Merismopedia sp. SIO2A8]|nr:transporter substrate-binding domain-containing protein [Symploca sp. SIO2B6]NET47622.1 transporter substrate-binding domain-containing protein [Merismopedia sp. SIO2A8]